MILAGDVGGTKTVLALYEEADGDLRPVRDATFPSQGHPTFEIILDKFLRETPGVPIRTASFGVAGPIIDGTCRTTNLPWQLDERQLAKAIHATGVKLLNDLEAAAYGMLHLQPDEVAVLNAGPTPARRGHVAVIAAGTGLGEAILYWDGQRHHPMASEGGHGDFAPRTDREIDLLRYLQARFGHVSYERVLSGPGFYNIYQFLRDTGVYPEPPWLTDRLKTGDPSAIITQAGLAGEAPLCVATIEMFASIYGAEAGNLALKCVTLGGVFVGGGIAPKMLAALQNGEFMRSFLNKGRLAELLRTIPVCIALNPRAPLIGAAHFAHHMT